MKTLLTVVSALDDIKNVRDQISYLCMICEDPEGFPGIDIHAIKYEINKSLNEAVVNLSKYISMGDATPIIKDLQNNLGLCMNQFGIYLVCHNPMNSEAYNSAYGPGNPGDFVSNDQKLAVVDDLIVGELFWHRILGVSNAIRILDSVGYPENPTDQVLEKIANLFIDEITYLDSNNLSNDVWQNVRESLIKCLEVIEEVTGESYIE
jgi:hypothetical protein